MTSTTAIAVAVKNLRQNNGYSFYSMPQVKAAAQARYKRSDELSEILAQAEHGEEYICTAHYMGGPVLAFANATESERAEIARLMKACNVDAAKKAAAKTGLELSLYGLCEETGSLFQFDDNIEQIAAQSKADALFIYKKFYAE